VRQRFRHGARNAASAPTEKADIPSDEAIFGRNSSISQEYWALADNIRRKVTSHSVVKARRPMNRWDVTFTA